MYLHSIKHTINKDPLFLNIQKKRITPKRLTRVVRIEKSRSFLPHFRIFFSSFREFSDFPVGIEWYCDWCLLEVGCDTISWKCSNLAQLFC